MGAARPAGPPGVSRRSSRASDWLFGRLHRQCVRVRALTRFSRSPIAQQFLFLRKKCRSLHNQRKRPAKLAWTVTYRKQHRKVRV